MYKYLNNNMISLVIQAGYEDGNIAEQIHNPCYCLYLHFSLNKLGKWIVNSHLIIDIQIMHFKMLSKRRVKLFPMGIRV